MVAYRLYKPKLLAGVLVSFFGLIGSLLFEHEEILKSIVRMKAQTEIKVVNLVFMV